MGMRPFLFAGSISTPSCSLCCTACCWPSFVNATTKQQPLQSLSFVRHIARRGPMCDVRLSYFFTQGLKWTSANRSKLVVPIVCSLRCATWRNRFRLQRTRRRLRVAVAQSILRGGPSSSTGTALGILKMFSRTASPRVVSLSPQRFFLYLSRYRWEVGSKRKRLCPRGSMHFCHCSVLLFNGLLIACSLSR
jgi:hypothetical protein